MAPTKSLTGFNILDDEVTRVLKTGYGSLNNKQAESAVNRNSKRIA